MCVPQDSAFSPPFYHTLSLLDYSDQRVAEIQGGDKQVTRRRKKKVPIVFDNQAQPQPQHEQQPQQEQHPKEHGRPAKAQQESQPKTKRKT